MVVKVTDREQITSHEKCEKARMHRAKGHDKGY